MTPLPKKRHSTMRQGRRRATIKLTLPNLVECPNCHAVTPPHKICAHCGFYKGKKIS